MSDQAKLPDLRCSVCSTRYPVASSPWRCACGGVLDVTPFATPQALDEAPAPSASLWRYQAVLPVPFDPLVSLGEGMTPLVPARQRAGTRLKLDFLTPTGSFKDRGAVVLATLARRLGVVEALVDSSGNAGTAAAAYLARAGVTCRVLVPASTSPGKLAQMRAHGADVTLVPGSRADTSAAAEVLADKAGAFYASHVWHPYFLHGVKTYGYEIWEQSGRRLPETVVVPVGNGTMLLGCHLAFTELVAAGLADRLPTLVAVQSERCAPLASAFARGEDGPVDVAVEDTVAEGIAIAAPPRGRQILQAVRAAHGAVVTVTDDQTRAARRELAAEGLFVEPTAAVCWAAVRAADAGPGGGGFSGDAARALTAGDVVVPLCGAGLKSPAL